MGSLFLIALATGDGVPLLWTGHLGSSLSSVLYVSSQLVCPGFEAVLTIVV
jgi:hypothetical protein